MRPLQIRKVINGVIMTNTYIVHCDGEGIIIDSGGETDKIEKEIENLEVRPKLLISTHGHFDHVMGMDYLSRKYEIPFYMSKLDQMVLLENKKLYEGFRDQLKNYSNTSIPDEFRPIDFKNIDIGGHKLEIIETPGHTPGSISIKGDGFIFSGDTIFRLSVGRFDLGGDPEKLVSSIKFYTNLDKNTKIYPGHGDSTDVRYEILNNSFLKDRDLILKFVKYKSTL
ncbi:MBL fold metallo-hydrolase [Caldiplasma sukawensis]